MARKSNPEMRDLRSLNRELQQLGPKGRKRFKDISARHGFDEIVAMSPGPNKQAAAANMMRDVQEAIFELQASGRATTVRPREEILLEKIRELRTLPGGEESLKEIKERPRTFGGRRATIEEIIRAQPGKSKDTALMRITRDVQEEIRGIRESSVAQAGRRGRRELRAIRAGKKEDSMQERRSTKKQKTKPTKASKKKTTLDEVDGTYEGFKYKLKQQLIGYNEKTGAPVYGWYGMVTRQARQIVPQGLPGEQDIHDHPDLKRPFTGPAGQSEADFAVRRAINKALFFYSSRGVRPREKGRHSSKNAAEISERLKRALNEKRKLLVELGDWGKDEWRKIVKRHNIRTLLEKKDDVEKHARLRAVIEDVKSAIRRVKSKRKEMSEKRTKERSKKSERGKTRRIASSPGRKVEFIPNPEPASCIRKGAKAEKESRKLLKEAEVAAAEGRAAGSKLMKAYDSMWLARVSYMMGGDKDNAGVVDEERRILRKRVGELVDACIKEIRKAEKGRVRQVKTNPKNNPTKAQHEVIGRNHLMASEKAWDKYCDTCKLADLLSAYEHLAIASEELKHAGDKKGMAQANAGLKAARKEIASFSD